MHQVKLVVSFHERLRPSEKEIAATIEVAEEMVGYFRVGSAVKINEHVTKRIKSIPFMKSILEWS